MSDFIVKESEWGPGYLLARDDEKMCCLGFAAEQCGVSREMLLGTMMPADILQSSIETLPTAFARFAVNLERPVGRSLAERINELFEELECGDSANPESTVGQMAANLNDTYHGLTAYRREEYGAHFKGLLGSLFVHIGYTLEFQP
jgi:hypothetical protein